MSATNAIGDFDLNAVKLRKKIEFPDGSIQTTAYTGQSGSENIQQVLTDGNNAGGLGIVNLGQIQQAINWNIIQSTSGGPIPPTNNLAPVLISHDYGGPGPNTPLEVQDSFSGQSVVVAPNTSNNSFNPIVQPNDACISTSSITGFCLTQDSATTAGVRITDTTVVLGAGGVADTPSCSTSYNTTAGEIIETSTSKHVIQTPDISPTPTLQIKETSSNYSMIFIPRSDGGQYNPLDTANANEMVAFIEGTTTDNGQILALVPHSNASCGIRMASGTAGSPTNASLLIGCGGGGVQPGQRIIFDNASSTMQLVYTGLTIATATSPSAGALSGIYLPVTVNGVNYKLPLYNP